MRAHALSRGNRRIDMNDDFTKLEQDAWGGLLGMYGRMFHKIDDHLQEHFRITHIEFEVLLRLSWADDHRLRIQDLAARSVLTRSGMSRAVERLERAGFVTRVGASEDRRGAYAVLTEAGFIHIRAALHSHVAFVKDHFLNFFSEQELKQMAGYWQRLPKSQA